MPDGEPETSLLSMWHGSVTLWPTVPFSCSCECTPVKSADVDITTNTTTTILWLSGFVQDYLGEPVQERYNPEGKTNLDLLEQETVSGKGISLATTL